MISSIPQSRSSHFAGLDGLRGVAAFAVVLYHVCLPLHVIVAAKGYLAVDLFFLLSGFVIGNAYEDRLRHSMSLLTFVRVRLVRLYPLFLLGMVMGIAVSLVKAFEILSGTSVPAFAVAAVMGVFMIPFGHLPYSEATFAFPFDGPAWSLFLELTVNFAYALVVMRLSTMRLYVVIAASGALLAFTAVLHGSADMGGELETFVGGLARTVFSFCTGLLLYRLVKFGSWRRRVPAGGVIAGLVLLAVLLVPFDLNGIAVDLVAIFVLFPMIILSAVGSEPTGWGRWFALKAGALSYPLYVTHYPIMRVFQFLAERRHLSGTVLHGMIVLEVVVMLAAAQLALSLYDQPVQAFFKRRLGNDRAKIHGVAPSLPGR